MYAVIETGGKQYQVKPGDEVFVEKLDVNAEDAVTFDKVMVVGAEWQVQEGDCIHLQAKEGRKDQDRSQTALH